MTRHFRASGLNARLLLLAAATTAALGLFACGEEQETRTYEWQLPAGFPEPLVPPDNPMSAVKVELGRRLFYDKRLSGNQTQACASCHEIAGDRGRCTLIHLYNHAACTAR